MIKKEMAKTPAGTACIPIAMLLVSTGTLGIIPYVVMYFIGYIILSAVTYIRLRVWIRDIKKVYPHYDDAFFTLRRAEVFLKVHGAPDRLLERIEKLKFDSKRMVAYFVSGLICLPIDAVWVFAVVDFFSL